jgi:hypothetical protein
MIVMAIPASLAATECEELSRLPARRREIIGAANKQQ